MSRLITQQFKVGGGVGAYDDVMSHWRERDHVVTTTSQASWVRVPSEVVF
jgi:hypothetical protein